MLKLPELHIYFKHVFLKFQTKPGSAISENKTRGKYIAFLCQNIMVMGFFLLWFRGFLTSALHFWGRHLKLGKGVQLTTAVQLFPQMTSSSSIPLYTIGPHLLRYWSSLNFTSATCTFCHSLTFDMQLDCDPCPSWAWLIGLLRPIPTHCQPHLS